MGPGRSSSLRIGGDSSAVVGSGRTGDTSDPLARVDLRDTLGEPPFPLNKGKGRIDQIKYPGESEYLRSALQNALAVGPSKVGPLYGDTFARIYRPPFSVRVWSLDILTSYVVPVPKMVCFFEVASDNGLRFPLHPFIKRGFASLQCLSFSTLAQLLGYFGWAIGFLQGQAPRCSQYSPVP